MTTYSIPENLPQPAQHYPFKPGEAVYYLPYPAGFCNKQQLIPAIVVKVQPVEVTTHRHTPRVTILRKDGKHATVRARNLAYQGYCAFCAVPAVLDCEALVCPTCGALATAAPPPDELTLRIFPIDHAGKSQIARISFLTGCTWGDALEERNNRCLGAFDALVKKHGMIYEMYRREGTWTEDDGKFIWFNAAMRWFAELGDEEAFISYYRTHAPGGLLPTERTNRLIAFFERLLGDDQPGPSRRMQLSPLDIPRIADDSEPDGADATTRWLDQQFRRAA